MLSNDVQNVLKDALMDVQLRKNDLFTLEHILFALAKHPHGKRLLAGCGVDLELLRSQLEALFRDELDVVDMDERYEIYQTDSVQRAMERAIRHIRSAGRKQMELGDLLVAIFEESESYASYYLRKQGIERIDILTLVSHGVENGNGSKGTESRAAADGRTEKGRKPEEVLAEFAVDLTARAAEGRIDPLVGREAELDRAIEVLCRRRKNNPLFVGDAGVGKTAIAEGLALRIARGEVPEKFANARIFALDMGMLLAGTRYRGDFESRLKNVIQAARDLPGAILFIDEIHTIVGAGATSGGSLDASNLLKPALASGEIRCIGSTTHDEYRQHFEKDRALARRFQRIDLHEPSEDDCVGILSALSRHYADHHEVKYSPAILKLMVELSSRHVTDRAQPDKAIDVMDETGAYVSLKNKRPDSEKKRLSQRPAVAQADVEKIVARMAGIPVRTVSGKEKSRLSHLEKNLKQLVFGQDEAVETSVRAILRARAGLGQPNRPAGAFLFYGPTGVGKTELAKSIASQLGVDFLRFDMSEYMEKHSVARLIGSPPGYVGFEQGGLLTEAVRKSPYSVLLLDELEKAHPDVFNILLQVMDYATLTDNTGRKADFSNVILIMTSNAGASEMARKSIGFGGSGAENAAGKGLEAIERSFSPEFRNRLDAIVPFNNLSREMMLNIVDKFLGEIRQSLAQRKVSLLVSEKARAWLAEKGFDPVMGARPLRRLLRSQVEDLLSRELLFGSLQKGGVARIGIADGALKLRAEPLPARARPSGNAEKRNEPGIMAEDA